MNKLIYKFNSFSLKNKLTISFIGFSIIPIIILSFFLVKYSSESIQDTVMASALQSNEQVIKNMDSFLEMLSKLSEYPISDSSVNKVILKDYTNVRNPEYERAADFNTISKFTYDKIKSFSDNIDSVVLYGVDTGIIYGRTPTDYLNTFYVDGQFRQEKWLKRIIDLNGGRSIIGVHRDLMQSPRGDYVISVGRCIIDPDSGKRLGVIIINTKVEKLKKLWMDAKITSGSQLYLVDENNNVISGKDSDEISRSIYDILGKKMEFKNKDYTIDTLMGQEVYLISSTSAISGWKVINLVPRRELLSYTDRIFSIAFISIPLGIILSMLIAVFIATGITRPLYKLNQKMKQIGKGNLDLSFDTCGGEVGDISRTAQKMLDEIKRLINRIYMEEEEKRNAEMLALQSQINPHFIYNTMNVIKWMAHIQGAPGIEKALASLSALLSFTARVSGDFISVNREVEFIQNYLEILSLRYYNKFSVIYDIDDNARRYKTLKFLLQPVVENSVFHGFEGLQRKGTLKIMIYYEENKLIFKVEDDGNGIDNDVLSRIFDEKELKSGRKLNSIGLFNVQKRIKLHFGEQYGVWVDSKLNEGTCTTIIIPAVCAADEDEQRGDTCNEDTDS